MSDPDFIGMSEHLGELRAEVRQMPKNMRPMGESILATLIKVRDRMQQDAAERTRLCALLRRAHDAMSRREPDGVPDAEWDQLVSEIAMEVGL